MRVRCMPLLDFAAASREMLIDVFAVQEAGEDDGIVLKSDAYAIIANPHAKIIPAAFELLQVR